VIVGGKHLRAWWPERHGSGRAGRDPAGQVRTGPLPTSTIGGEQRLAMAHRWKETVEPVPRQAGHGLGRSGRPDLTGRHGISAGQPRPSARPR
jgi:hypothetical protein